MEEENIWNLPNILTILRIALVAVLIYFFAVNQIYYALGTFLLACVTDYLDGYIARKNKLITTFGKLMDPFADKLMLVTTLICLTLDGRVSIWVVLLVIAKETTMVVGGYLMYKRGIVVHAQMIGKVATVVFGFAVAACFLREFISPFDNVLMIAAVFLTIAAFFWYLVKALQKVNEQSKPSR